MNRHFGELGDVWKHLPLAEVLRVRPPRHYWETHAGSVSYPLSASEARLHGSLRFLAEAPSDPDLADCAYLAALRSSPGAYPGSAALALRQLETRASYLLCDLDPQSANTLRQAFRGLDAGVVEGDGVSAVAQRMLAGAVDPAGVLVHIDPFEPHERAAPGAPTPVEIAGRLAISGYRLFYWYGYDELGRRGWARGEISDRAPGVELWCGDALMPASHVYPGLAGAWGCGVVLANFTSAESAACERLGRALERISAGDVVDHNEPSRLTFSVL
ncbi:MAG TPA: 23S rRNA (adenine(2030)-N(6))-methyltransferase RlmJ [Candidatus Eisenbacteria bacterium]